MPSSVVVCSRAAVLLLGLSITASAARAQQVPDPADGPQAQPQAAAAQAPEPRADADKPVDVLEPDFALVGLPTTLRVPEHRFSFRVTHRFTRPLGQGDFGDLVSDGFGIDGGAQIGLELRYGLLPGTQIGVHRTSDRTIQIFGQQSLLSERHGGFMSLDAYATIEGENNLQDHHQSTLGLVSSKKIAKRLAVYAEPLVVINSNPLPVGDSDTFMVGLGARWRVRPALYLVGEYTPRLAGFDPGVDQVSFGLEGRAGGHLFQLNFSNGFGTTLGQISRGGITNDNWYFGFNISRKFF